MFEAGATPTTLKIGRDLLAALSLAGFCAASCAGKVVTGNPGNAGGSTAARASGGASSVPASGGYGNESTPQGLPTSGGSGTSLPGSTASGGSSTSGSGPTMPGTGAAGNGATAGAHGEADSLFIIPQDGWVDGASNALHVQGAVFTAADETSSLGLISNFMGNNACMKGTAARVDQASDVCVTHMFPPPAVDCYGYYWGAEIALNLNQQLDPTTMSAGTPAPFDASALRGFSFEIGGNTVPGPLSLRFQVETDSQVFCTPATSKIKIGLNKVQLSELVTECFRVTDPPAPTAETAKRALIKLSWLVVTNTNSTVPFDFCVSNLRAFK